MSQIPAHERANLWAICAAQFLTLAGMTAVIPLLPLYLQQIGVGSPDELRYWTGALGSAPFVVSVFATPIWGALADRVGHKPMVVRSVGGIALAVFGMAMAGSPVALLGWRALQGAVSGVVPAAVALLAALTPEARMGRALAILQSSRSAGTLSGPLIGGLLADLIGIRALLVGVGVVAAATAVASSLILVEPPRATAESGPAPQRPGDWRGVLRQPALLVMLTLVCVFQTTVMASWPTLALFVELFTPDREAVATMTGIVVFAAGLPAMLLATAWARLSKRFTLPQLISASLISTGAANLAIGLLSTNIETVIALRAVYGLAMAGFIPLAFQWLNGLASSHARARMAGLGSTAMMVGSVFGPLLGGWLSVRIGLAATFWVPGGALALIGILFAVSEQLRDT